MKNYFVINPMSGKGDHSEELAKKIREICEKRSVDYECYFTKGVGDATKFVREICADESNLPARFYACGGDGTLCEVANGVGIGKAASIGIIPVGTGNDFVRNFGSSDLFFDIDAQLDGEDITIDLLRCNDTFAINMVNIGFDCEVVKKKEAFGKKKFLPKKLAYIAGLVACLVKKPTVRISLTLGDGETEERHFLLTTIANGSFCGGGFRSNPYSRLDDGRLDVISVENVTRTKFLSLVGSYKKGTHINEKTKKILGHGKYDSIEMDFHKPHSVCIDGELFEFEKLLLSCEKNAASFILPKGIEYSVAAEPAASAV